MDNHNVIMNAQHLAQPDLLLIPGVTGVGVGLREVAGQVTDEVVIRVYVEKKKSLGTLELAQIIPEFIDGHKTDVIANGPDKFCGAPGEFKERPIPCGLQITRYSGFLGTKFCFGTIGCFVEPIHPKGINADFMMLTNAHVLHPDLLYDISMTDDKVYQCESILGANCIGIVSDISSFGDTVDAAIAWSGADYGAHNYVWKFGQITGTAQPVLGELVAKFGRTTGLTMGRVVDINQTHFIEGKFGERIQFNNQIRINYHKENSEGDTFADSGDSGAVVLNMQRQVIGLLMSRDGSGAGCGGSANNIANVFSKLDIKLLT